MKDKKFNYMWFFGMGLLVSLIYMYINFPKHFFPELTKISCGASKKECDVIHRLDLHSRVNTVRVI